MHAASLAAVALGALLVFLLEPLVGKALLPVFGGSSAMWGACLVFFQAVVFAGYAYAHGVSRKLGPRRQIVLHLVVLAVAAAALPLTLVGRAVPEASSPAVRVLLTLAVAVGLPTFVISATAPLVQRLSVHVEPGRDPYLLYAASNAGSLLALLAYPFFVEPRFDLSAQARGWTFGYALLGLVFVALTGFVLRTKESAEAEVERTPLPPWQDRGRWVVLSALPSALLVEVTSMLTTDVTPIPLLWVLPLAIYLVTFILAFGGSRAAGSLARRALPIAAAAGIGLSVAGGRGMLSLIIHVVVFGTVVLAMHDRLAKDRPPPDHLTMFYLWTSFGGIVGGASASLLAPLLLVVPLEYPLTLALATLVWREKEAEEALEEMPPGKLMLRVLLAVFLGVEAVVLMRHAPDVLSLGARPLAFALAPALLAAPLAGRVATRRAGVVALLATALLARVFDPPVLYRGRDFYGAVRVVDNQELAARQFFHGTTLHGQQQDNSPRTPTSYYHPTGPFGDVRKVVTREGARFGVAGLGTGSLAAYAKPDEDWTFYEISDIVRQVAENPALFTFLRDGFPDKSHYRVKVDDARLAIAKEPEHAFDALVLDAFSSDAIPVHLLTREALALYTSRVRSDGIVVFHVSNQYVDVASEVVALARSFGQAVRCRVDELDMKTVRQTGKFGSKWCVVAAGAGTDLAVLSDEWREKPERVAVPWTDERSSLLPLLQ